MAGPHSVHPLNESKSQPVQSLIALSWRVRYPAMFAISNSHGEETLMPRKWIVLIGVILVGFTATGQGRDWPQFRGPGNAGVSTEKQLPAEWGKDKNVQWHVKLS